MDIQIVQLMSWIPYKNIIVEKYIQNNKKATTETTLFT